MSERKAATKAASAFHAFRPRNQISGIDSSARRARCCQPFLSPNWSVLAKFDGEFANGSQTYAGTGALRYTR
jgi:hypothetical protein